RTSASEVGALEGNSTGVVAACFFQQSGSTTWRPNIERVQVGPPARAITCPICFLPYPGLVRSSHDFGGFFNSSELYAIDQTAVERGQSLGETRVSGM